MDAEALLRHAGFVRAIARGLLQADEADDVVQDTMLAAWERPPRDPSRARAWLGAVARRLSLKRLRSDRRRGARERAAARREALPSAAEVTGQLEIQRRVVEAVVALEEPYRSTVVHRFLHDRPVEEIAKGLGLPKKTVESRLTRALAMLRARLDADAGGRRAWSLALLPLAWPRSGASVLGGIAMTAKAKTAVVGTMLVAAALGVWATRDGAREDPVDRAPRKRDPLPIASAEPPVQPAAAATAGPPGAEPLAPAAPAAVPPGTILGHIRLPDGSPAKGARVTVEGWLTREDGGTPVGGGPYDVSRATEVDEEGFYRFEGLAPGGYFPRVEREGYAAQRSQGYIIDAKGGARWSTTLHGGGTLGVIVRDVAGAPLPGVEVEVVDGKATTDAKGEVVFDHLPAGVYPVSVRLVDDELARIAKVGEGVTTTLSVVVGAVLRGTVTLEEDGTPVRDAAMWAALDLPSGAACFAEGRTDAAGRYELRGLGPGEWKVRMGNAGVSSEPRLVRLGDEPSTRLDLRLQRPSIAGRLASSRAGPLPGMVNLFGGGRIRSIRAGEDGAFVFHEVAPGEYVLSVQPHRGGYARREVPVVVGPGERLEGVEVRIEDVRYGEVELEISDRDGALTGRVQMFVGDPEGWKMRQATSMAPAPVSPGRFKLQLECGRRVITVRGKRGEVRVDVEVEEGKTVYRTVRLDE